MKKMINDIFGSELKWFRGLAFGQKFATAYMVVSLILLLTASASDSALLMLIGTVNAAAATALMKKVQDEGLEE